MRRVLAAVAGYKWPGNVRELRNRVERMAILSAGDVLTLEAIPAEIRMQPESASRSVLHETRESAERGRIRQALEDTETGTSRLRRGF